MSDVFDLMLSRLPNAKEQKSNDPRIARQGRSACPAHGGTKRSVNFSVSISGTPLIHCFAGCQAVDVITRPELAPNSPLNAYRVPESSNNHTQTISREEIEQLRPTDAFELLNSSTGVIATSGSRKGFKGLSIRGDANFIWIIDGAYLQSSMASRMMNTLPVGAIEEVKIVRGGSALFLERRKPRDILDKLSTNYWMTNFP